MNQPFYWVNDLTNTFLSRGYLSEGETPQSRVRNIADHAESLLGVEGFSDKFYTYMSKGYYSLSSPVWSNFGKQRGLPVSCFGSDTTDSVPGILQTVSEIGAMSKLGGGTACYLGKLRPRGSTVTDNGKSTGTVHFMELFQATTDVISQGSQRRGRTAAYLPIDHGDIEEFLKVATEGHPVQNMTTAVVIPEGWMQSMLDGDQDKRSIWAKLLKTRSELGYPYVMFKDNANGPTKPDVYHDKNMPVNHSQLCMVGSDRVVSQYGYLTAKELHDIDTELTLFDGNTPVQASKMKLREKDVPVYKITLDNGMEHTVTEYHGIPVLSNNKIVRTECKDLKLGDRVPVQTSKGLFGTKQMPDEAFLLGMYQSDGTQHKDIVMLDLWENDFDLIEEIENKFAKIHSSYGCDTYEVKNQTGKVVGTRKCDPATFNDCVVANGNIQKKRLASKTLHKALNFQKGFVPDWIWSADEATQWEYVRGLLIADGTVFMSQSQGNPIQIAYTEINLQFLKELQLLFQNLGLKTSIRQSAEAGERLLPDGKGGHKYYSTKDCYRLIVGNKPDALLIEKHTGFLTRKGIQLEDREYADNTKKAYKVVAIEYAGTEDVYCPTVNTEEHIFIAQGMKTFNCSEIFLPTNEDESFVCVLSSMNLLHYDEWKDTDAVETLTYFLDAVVTDFINHMDEYASSPQLEKRQMFSLMERAYKFAVNHRALGLGTLGWHSYLQSKQISFESREAAKLNLQIAKLLKERTYAASTELASIFGEPALLQGYGRRNTTLLAIAPTTSSAFILGQVSQSIEPLFSNYYVKDLAKTKVPIKNKYLQAILQERGFDTKEVWDNIMANDGSVYALSDKVLPPELKEVFKTYREINQESIIDQASTRQAYMDQGQSLNLMITNDLTPKEISQLHIRAWQLGIKSLYYQHSVNQSQEFARSKTCVACEA